MDQEFKKRSVLSKKEETSEEREERIARNVKACDEAVERIYRETGGPKPLNGPMPPCRLN